MGNLIDMPENALPHQPQRDSRLDFLRGLCLIVMVINHLPSMPLQKLTYETLGFISSAEGFILISGVTSGWIYSRRDRPAAKRIFARWLDLYLTYAALICFLLPLNSLIAGTHLQVQKWFLALLGSPGPLGDRAGILLIYVVLFPCLPFFLDQFQRGRAPLVLCGSFGLWLLGQFRIGPSISIGFLLSWQFLFILGTWIGYRRRFGLQFPGLSSSIVLKTVAISFVVLFCLRHPIVHVPFLSLTWAITNKEQLGIVRLLDVDLLAFLIARIPRTPVWFVSKWPGWSLYRAGCFLGRHSLQVFSWHVLVVWLSNVYSKEWTNSSLAVQLSLTILITLSLFLPAYLHEKWKLARLDSAPSDRDSHAKVPSAPGVLD